ncbi:hypothetical protein KWAN_97 [Erwinia phage vB_EamM_Kwan]|uniref:Uncharacterized protein n=1 Tax=Erwinia phage vB_EamM_Kwan TaxID=1883374 RepID=A0A1B2IDW8_9CAUD|nr:hypothetical protein BIZ80_gp202 [Erwinia phage vB_EamM_Kwan]ANZ49449.1 hypothetical protein KWAN_97 [Erwinia phage vB_EamM_Kwan]
MITLFCWFYGLLTAATLVACCVAFINELEAEIHKMTDFEIQMARLGFVRIKDKK